MIKSINSHRELQNICNMSPWHDLMYSCIDTTSQRKHCKALSRQPVVTTLWFSITIWHYFYLPSLFSYSWLLRGVKVSHTVYLFHSFSNPLFTRFFCCWWWLFWGFFLGCWFFFSVMDDFQWPDFICSSFYDFTKAMAKILLSGYFLVIKEEKHCKLLLTIQKL